jgi:anti-sigma B factor antagonist
MSSFSVREEPDVLVVTIEDPAVLNDFRSNTFRDAIYETVESSRQSNVAVNLGCVDFLSSSGVAILVGLKRRIDGRQGKLALFKIQPIVVDLLRVIRLNQYFTIAEDEPGALALLRPAKAL